MSTWSRVVLGTACGLFAAAAGAPAVSAQGHPDTTTARDTAAKGEGTAPKLALGPGWPSPVNDRENHTYLLADVLEYRPKAGNSDFRWDIEGWHGGDFNRLWFKSEGQENTAFKADYDIDLQLLYGRFVWKYYDFQVGGRLETQTFRGENVTRGLAVVGLEGLVPYSYEVESELFIDQDANISARLSATKDLLMTQRLILQPRIETELAAQRVERFTTGSGINNLELGFRLRYEIWRKFGPYVGVSFDWSFFDTADLVRADGGDPSQVRFVAGVRAWR
jgi:copper resistance protein B